jgi:hypothetical protein
MEKLLFLAAAIIVLASLICMSYKSSKKRFPTMFIVSLLVFGAFYLFQYGSLSSFTLKALSAEASFIREKKEEVAQDAESVAKMKIQIENLLVDSQKSQQQIEKATSQILALKSDVGRVTSLASTPTLQLTGRGIESSTSGLKITLQFTSSKNEPLGLIVFKARIVDNSEARILDFWPNLIGGAYSTGPGSRKIEKDGKEASLSYSLISPGRLPTFDLTVSKKAKISIEGNYLNKAITVTDE